MSEALTSAASILPCGGLGTPFTSAQYVFAAERVIVNLVDNAAEAMEGSLVRRIVVSTRAVTPESIELTVADTGCGVSPEDKEKLFLPYFSTKGRGTGLGLAIVSHILAEHHAQIRVEDNQPAGARFLIDIPTAAVAEVDWSPVEAKA